MIATINVQCLRTKLNVVDLFVDEIKPTVLCVTEHWLSLEESAFYTRIGCELVLASIYSRQEFIHGGSAIFVNTNTSFKEVDVANFCIEKVIEIVAVELTDTRLIIISLYRSPDGDFPEFINKLSDCLQFISRSGKPIVMAGDFNIHLERQSREESVFTNLLRTYGLFITSRRPTRNTACLDTIATSLNTWEYTTTVIDPTIADHSAVIMEIKPGESPKQEIEQQTAPWKDNYIFSKRIVKDELLPVFRNVLKRVDWVKETSMPQTDTPLENFISTFNHKFNCIFPTKILNQKKPRDSMSKVPQHDKSWYTPSLCRLKNLVKFINDRVKSTVSPDERERLFLLYLKTNRLYRNNVKEAKKAFNVNVIERSSNKCKAAWSIINQHRPKRPKVSCPASPDDFNSFFLDSVKEIVDGLPSANFSVLSDVRGPGLQNWKEVTPEEVCKIVNNLKNSNSPDIYGVSCNVLKFVINEIASPLSSAINCCLRDGVFPNSLKIGRTVPVYKKGNAEEITNYRPISILPVLSKVIETTVKNQLCSYFESNNLLSDAQHGFRRERSTTTAVLSLASRITETFESGNSLALTLCDLSRAFDCVPHDILLSKLKSYGVKGITLQTISSYLEDRRQVVSLEGACSASKEIVHGVPQGSVLGPLLFLILINDLGADGRALLFADDTTLVTEGKCIERMRSEAGTLLERTMEWFASNKLKLNEDKTQLLICTLGRQIADEDNMPVKLLGFWLDQKLNWDHHIAQICVKLSRVVFLLRKLRDVITEPYLVTVYYSLFHSHIVYGILLWGHTPACSRLLLLQKEALRVITYSVIRGGDFSHRPLFKRLNILTVYGQYVYNSLIHIRQNISTYGRRQDVHQHNTRSAGHLDVPQCRLSKTLKSFPVSAIRLFNSLPEDVRNKDITSFKTLVRAKLMSRPIYSVKELDDVPLF